MHPLEMIKRATAEQCREIGEIFIWAADRPRDETFRANIDMVLARFQSPEDESIIRHMQRASERVEALNDGLRADGMNHQKLIAEELVRRGDDQSVDDYCRSVCSGDRLPHSDVMFGDFARD